MKGGIQNQKGFWLKISYGQIKLPIYFSIEEYENSTFCLSTFFANMNLLITLLYKMMPWLLI